MNLYRLEWMKIRLNSYLWAVAGIFFCLLALGILFLFIYKIEAGGYPMGAGESVISEDAELFGNWNGLLSITTALAFAFFSILSAAMAAKVIIGEYCGKNAVILLSYPIERNALLRVKCLMVCGITTISAWISNLLVVGMMYAVAYIFRIVPQMNTKYFVFTVLISSFLMGISSSAVGIISAAFGWEKRSAIATIVCSLIIVCVLTNFITISPGNIIWVMLAFSTICVGAANFIYHILDRKIMRMEV